MGAERVEEQSRRYQRDGYLVVPDVLTGPEVDELIAETAEIARGNRAPVRGLVPIDPGTSDDEALGRYLAIHFPHKASELIRSRYVAHPRMAEILAAIIGPNVKCMQSMLFVKPAGKPGQAWHQDEYFIPTRDRSLVGLWLALDDATVQNGCVWVRPGSHQDGVLYPARPHGTTDFDEGDEIFGTPHDNDPGIPIEVAAGSILAFNGYLHHRSLPNQGPSGTFRRALVNHYMSAESLLPWDWDGRLEPTSDMRDVVMVCGEDPYRWKGYEDLTYPYLRAETRNPSDPNHDPMKKVF
ncbi:MAG: phytanoyl-CoA dioxygenase family protein [Acidimicrobiales bacterium]